MFREIHFLRWVGYAIIDRVNIGGPLLSAGELLLICKRASVSKLTHSSHDTGSFGSLVGNADGTDMCRSRRIRMDQWTEQKRRQVYCASAELNAYRSGPRH